MAQQVARKARKEHDPAPYARISTWERTGGQPIPAALSAEGRAVSKLATTPTARNLVRVYFLMERLKGLGGKEHGITHVHVIGAGVMGGNIAAWCALRVFDVTLPARELKSVQPSMARVPARNGAGSASHGALSASSRITSGLIAFMSSGRESVNVPTDPSMPIRIVFSSGGAGVIAALLIVSPVDRRL